MKVFEKAFPWLVFLIAVGYLFYVRPRSYSESNDNLSAINYNDFAANPVMERGRLKPLDTVARTNLMIISGGYQEWKDEDNVRQPAIKWLLDVMVFELVGKGGDVFNSPAAKHKVFRIDNDQLLSLLNLENRKGYRYALNEIVPRKDEFYKVANEAKKIEPKNRDLYQTKVVELAQHIELFLELAMHSTPSSIPVLNEDKELWLSVSDALKQGREAIQSHEAASAQVGMLAAYASKVNGEGSNVNPVGAFNEQLAAYRKLLSDKMSEETAMARFEMFFNKFAPFYHAIVLYVWVFALAALSWLVWPRAFNRAAFWLAILAFSLHTWALLARMYIQGRPPVTNLYSSAIFIGWGCVVLCLLIELLYRNGVGTAVGAITGGCTLIIAHQLSLSGDTLEPLEAVLATNFWLATHVTIITFGYTATFVAGFLGIMYILFGVCTPLVTPDVNRFFNQAVYGTICFAMLLSFLGTVLGGIWADQSWGRFWGWDPKENGALLIVLWNALILHARWGGMVKQRGIAVLAVLGNIVTAWSWFGVNMLGVGLHSYGFMAGALQVLAAFAGSQVVIAGIGLIPLGHWASFSRKAGTTSHGMLPGLEAH